MEGRILPRRKSERPEKIISRSCSTERKDKRREKYLNKDESKSRSFGLPIRGRCHLQRHCDKEKPQCM